MPRLLLATLLLAGCHTDRILPPAPGGGTSGLPCDVASLLSTRCLACHGPVPAGGAPMSLASFEDLQAPSLADPSRTMAEESLLRMQDAARPMPPAGLLPAEEVAVLEAWVNDGAPQGSCDQVPGGGLPDSPPGCASGEFWDDGDDGDRRMYPGRACLECHLREEPDDDDVPHAIGGTVYPALREFDDCNGTEGVTVEITGSDGAVLRLESNSAGNFFSDRTIATPYTARLLFGGRVREMLSPQTSGDCNACHTESGANGAPGRIVAP